MRDDDLRNLPFAELHHRIRGGDAAATAEFHRRYEPFLRRAARRWLSPALRRQADSGDIAQSAFRQILPRLAMVAFEHEDRLRGWLAVIARARVARLGRRAAPPGGGRFVPIGPEDVPALAEGDPVAFADLADRVHRLKSALDRLPPDERCVVLLRDFEEIEFAEIARAMGRPSADAARKLHARALKRLRGTLARRPGVGRDAVT